MKDTLEEKLARFEELERQLSDPETLGNSTRMGAVAREHGSLAKMANKYKRFKDIVSQIQEARELENSASDPDEREMAEEEIASLLPQREALWDELLLMTIGGEDANRSRCVIEIRAGTGGEEAALFAADLHNMYQRYCDKKGWKMQTLDFSESDMGGYKEITATIEGEGCYRELQYESGGHRVQRVPDTEAKGRIHTSAATVAVMPEPEDVEVELNPADYEVERYCASSGAGGQHVNRTASAIRIIHHPTGVVVKCIDERSQHKNLAKAMRILKSRVYDFYQQRDAAARATTRKNLVGSGDRSQRIRTYNFPDNRVSDHRINLTIYKLDQVMLGNVDLVIQELIDHDRQTLRDEMGSLD
ncbi:MAG: peptide chain release factor 1 [Pirellulaceae bacterium]|nr:peptide chain release factor 1 [Pirellulaceae bacterium]